MFFLKVYREIIRRIFYVVFSFKRIDEKFILFQTEGDFWDNGRALYEYLINRHYNEKYVIIWLVNQPELYRRHIKRNVLFIKSNSFCVKDIMFESLYLITSKYLFFTHRGFKQRRKNQVVINLWHGSVPMKAMQKKPVLWKYFDYQLCPSWNAADRMKLFTGVKKHQVLICSDCRLDLFFDSCNSKLFDFLNIKDEKLILVMPTFKKCKKWQDGKILPYILPMINFQEELEELNDFCVEQNLKIVIKVHHLEDTTYIKQLSFSHLIVVKDEELQNVDIQLYELVGKADALISDFSSIVYDFMLLNKPIGYMLSEMDSYKRGFIVDNIESEMCGEKIYTLEDLKKFIFQVKLGKDTFKEQREKMVDFFYENKEGNNCKHLIEILGL